ncbi:hypothetical protein ACWT_2963 [Actinoplanes sp. SE50]|uniref:hypothetical protein n=1 Tax=unclassified Actinoplanes TaxID=2626549 RepID=UPI00023EBB7C|nr:MULTISPECIES: hypothetical protein [unclassified Actinoplanes]AEV83985.1 hypothetical protein ACPL_3090 [Actinoplanes sp. SE50/110]ATO82378.1 hypothetical protein ACWT_2963 [Actinoplanes sp. SE50]SLL99785.1 hypothetical protein ACSP50_3016 [Actinoplanes sp. SE50/110]
MSGYILRGVAFPFPGGRFPERLGAVVQRTVLTGEEPARVVIHDEENDWLVGDGVNDPDLPGASVIACIATIADTDPGLAELATLPVGRIARRDEAGKPWTVDPHTWPDDL